MGLRNSHSVMGSRSSLAVSAIAAFKRSKPELSGFLSLKHAISLPSFPPSGIDKAQQRNNLIKLLYQDPTKLSKSTEKFVLTEVRAYYLP